MRLTPSWVRSSSKAADEGGSGDSNTTGEVTIYQTPLHGESGSTSNRAVAGIPESDVALLAELEKLETPVTVDKITDQIVAPAHPPVEQWARVHEQLHETRLPALDTAGDIVFDERDGLVEYPQSTQADAQSDVTVSATVSRTVVSRFSMAVYALFVLLLMGAVLFVAMAISV